jgi:hypothetical protein
MAMNGLRQDSWIAKISYSRTLGFRKRLLMVSTISRAVPTLSVRPVSLGSTDTTSGQVFYADNWNVIVRGDSCEMITCLQSSSQAVHLSTSYSSHTKESFVGCLVGYNLKVIGP